MNEPLRREIVCYVRLWGLPDHPLANQRGMVYEHRMVLYKKIGPGSHPCHFCGQTVTWVNGRGKGYGPTRGALHTEHLDGDGSNNHPDNLVPCCSGCNLRHGYRKNRIQPDEAKVKTSGGWTRAVAQTCAQCGDEFLAAPSDYRDFCSRDCADAAKVVAKCKRDHPRTPENTYEYAPGRTRCKQCQRLAEQRFQARKREASA